MIENSFFSSESVSEGHPDKIADQISDAILDDLVKSDPYARVACETMVKTGMVFIAGEITTNAWSDFENIVRRVISKIGYTNSELGFDAYSCAVISAIGKQSTDIARGIDHNTPEQLGAGDQGIMFGFACKETEALMPLPIFYAHKLMQYHAEVRKKGLLPWLRPDAKTQVTVRYIKNKPISIDTIIFSTQHDPQINNMMMLKEAVIETIIRPIIPEWLLTNTTKFFINPTGRFVIGGPAADCGLTGRKIIVDTYGGMARHGGGAFSGKDATKVDRSGAYMARYIAKNIVAAGFASKCEVQLSYAIGMSEPISVYLDFFNTNIIPAKQIIYSVNKTFNLRPGAIIEELNLRQPIYQKTSTYGHFGREESEFSWEKTNKVALLQQHV